MGGGTSTHCGCCKCECTNWMSGVFRQELHLNAVWCKVHQECTEDRDWLKWTLALLGHGNLSNLTPKKGEDLPHCSTFLHHEGSRWFWDESVPRWRGAALIQEEWQCKLPFLTQSLAYMCCIDWGGAQWPLQGLQHQFGFEARPDHSWSAEWEMLERWYWVYL